MTVRAWDASSYDRMSAPMTAMAAVVVDRLGLAGDETVLDAGCGTGRVTELILQQVPRGRVVAVDADPEMIEVARRNLAGRAEIRQADLLDLVVDAPVDAILSTATFHWIDDHARLFDRLFAALVPGGRLEAQCGGVGNITSVRAAAEAVSRRIPFAAWLEGWTPPGHYAGPEETAARVRAAGFEQERVWLQPWTVVPGDPAEYLATIPLGPQVQRLPPDLQSTFVDAVIELLPSPVEIAYVRLNISARKPG